jgi:phage repressor protein C with HTH and peptisase S24 domain
VDISRLYSYIGKNSLRWRAFAEADVARQSMLTHAEIWTAIERLAARSGLSASGLAKKAGLDPTTFNKSKRITPDGRPRWPSTESVAKALDATGTEFATFVGLISEGGAAAPVKQVVPLLGLAQASSEGYFDEFGYPVGTGWDEIAFPAIEDEHAYALEITGEAMQPAYRDGTIIIVSPTTPLRRGDRVVVKTKAGELTASELKRRTAKTVELKPFNPEAPDRTLAEEELAWIARIVWASQ